MCLLFRMQANGLLFRARLLLDQYLHDDPPPECGGGGGGDAKIVILLASLEDGELMEELQSQSP